MATGDGLQASELTVLIGAADATSSSCTNFTTSLDNFSQSGGGRDIESVPLFGGAFLDREQPREQVEVTLDAKWKYGTDMLLDQLAMGSVLDGSTEVDSADDPTGKVIYMTWTDGTNYYTRAYNNISAVNLGDVEQSADGFLQGTFTFKCAPTDSSSNPNVKITDAAASTLSWP